MLKQIQKRTAKKLYEQGKNVFFIPCKLSPYNKVWNLGIWQNKNLNGQYKDFETLYNSYCYYNCTNETGTYIHFYIEQ